MKFKIVASIAMALFSVISFAKPLEDFMPGLERLHSNMIKPSKPNTKTVTSNSMNGSDFNGNWLGECEGQDGVVFESSANIVNTTQSIIVNDIVFKFDNVAERSFNNPNYASGMRTTVEWLDNHSTLVLKFLSHDVFRTDGNFTHAIIFGTERMHLEGDLLKLDVDVTTIFRGEPSKLTQHCVFKKQQMS